MFITQLTDEELHFQTDEQALKYIGADPNSFQIISIEEGLEMFYAEMHKRGIYPTDGDIGK